jgi:hypothetical protein
MSLYSLLQISNAVQSQRKMDVRRNNALRGVSNSIDSSKNECTFVPVSLQRYILIKFSYYLLSITNHSALKTYQSHHNVTQKSVRLSHIGDETTTPA